MNEPNTPSPYEPVPEAALEPFYSPPVQQNGRGHLVPSPQPQVQAPAYSSGPHPQQSAQYSTNHATPMAGGYPSALTDQRPQGGGVVAIAWIVALLTAFYMLPWAIAVSRGKTNMTAIGLVNLLLGWSLIAWVIAFVMALGSHGVVAFAQAPVQVFVAQQSAPPVAQSVPAGWYPAPSGVGQEYWDGGQWTGHRAP